MAQITVFHTSDIHNKLKTADFERVGRVKASVPGALLFDSGDAIWSGNIYWRIGGEPILKDMSAVPYDAMCVGNREYHLLKIGMDSKISCADFPILSANLRAKGDIVPESVPYVSFEREGVKITVVGFTVPCVTEEMFVEKLASYYFEKPIPAAEEIVPKLRADCDLLIALTHIGIGKDRELAKKTDIDIIFGGHTHTVTPEPEFVSGTYILHSDCHGKFLRKTVIDTDSPNLIASTELIPLKETK
ncbi:MAG: metallophosphatase [Abditibacteriota bacterium]|nr:metallophosphatase [Abditibacteriota bacterium]